MRHNKGLKTVFSAAAAVMLLTACQTATRYDRSTGQYIDDKATSARVNSALNEDSLLGGADIEVKTFRGHVLLIGFVDHPVQRQRASEVVQRVGGVQWFRNDLVVKNQLPTASAQTEFREPAGAQRGMSQQEQDGWQRGPAFRPGY